MGYSICGMFFYRFFLRSREVLFLFFSLAFCLFATEKLVLLYAKAVQEAAPFGYLVRLLGFIVILSGVVFHNAKKAE
jgi:hypothetical protein